MNIQQIKYYFFSIINTQIISEYHKMNLFINKICHVNSYLRS